MFGAPLPTFNLKGKNTVHTVSGGIMTFLVILVMLIYGSIKMFHLVSRDNPNIVAYLERNYYTHNNHLDLNKIDFHLAFSFEGFHSRELKDN